MREKVKFVEDFAEIGEYFDQPVKTYSSGMRARVNFGMSLAFDFDYYLMDEIGAVGDAGFKEKSGRILRDRIAHSHVIMVSHSYSEIARICDVVLLVQDGRVTQFNDVTEGAKAYKELSNSPSLEI